MEDLIRQYTTPLDNGVADGLRRQGLDSFADRVEEERLPSYRAEIAARRSYLTRIEQLTVALRKAEAKLHRRDRALENAEATIKRLEGALDDLRRR